MENIYKRIPEALEYMNIQLMDKSEHTIRSYESALNRFFEFMNIQSIEDIKKIVPSDGRSFQAKAIKDGLQPSSINSCTRPLKAFYNWLLENEYVEVNPFLKVKDLRLPKKMLAFFSEEEVHQLLSSCKKIEEKTIFAILFSTGLRRDELVNLKLTDVTGYNLLVNGKGSKQRVVSLPEDIYQLFLEYMEWRNKKYGMDIPYVFVSKMRCKYAGESIRSKLKVAMERAGFSPERIAELHTHSTRHTFCSDLIENEVDLSYSSCNGA
jgi:site-specific recombinase XerD